VWLKGLKNFLGIFVAGIGKMVMVLCYGEGDFVEIGGGNQI